MNKKTQSIYFVLFFVLSFSCVQKKSTEKELNKSELLSSLVSDSFKFTSGIRAIFQDNKGNYWFGSHEEGVCLYDGSSFKYFTVNEGLLDNQVRSIQEDDRGNIWFGTANGVSSFDGKIIQKYIAVENVESEWTKNNLDLWFNAGTRQGVYRYDGQKLNYLDFPMSKNTSSGSVYAVSNISKGKNNMLWFATYAGVFGNNGKQFTVINDETLQLADESSKMHVRSIFEDSKGRLWIGNNGIGVILKIDNSIIHFSKEHGKLLPTDKFEANIKSQELNKNTGLQAVFAIAEDSDGNIWFGDRDSGAWRYDGETSTNYAVDEKLSSQMVLSIYEDQNKSLLLGMAEGGIYKFNGKSFDKWL